MSRLARTLLDPVTYRRLIFILLGLPLGIGWFVTLVTLWSLCAGLFMTPVIVPLAFALAFTTRALTAVEGALARTLLGVDSRPPSFGVSGRGFLRRLRSLFGEEFWRAQGYLWLRWFIGFPVAVLFLSLVAGAGGLLVAPLWVPFAPGSDLGGWHVHTFLQSLALVPLGAVLLPLAVAAAHPAGGLLAELAARMLPGSPARSLGASAASPRSPGSPETRTRKIAPERALVLHASASGSVVGLLVLVWAITSLGYFWPIWVALALALPLGIHAWFVALHTRPGLLRRFGGNPTVARTSGAAGVLWLFTFCVWLITNHGYFWPVWTLLGLGLAVLATAVLDWGTSAQMAERIETLEATRAGAVSVQDSELRRIERDLHDGAQARLVALGMSIGRAEQKLAENPEQVGELLAEARAGAEQALRELRDLARGIHPPVLADRGLEAALAALAASTPMHVALSVDVPERPPSSVESAAYFVAAESLTNAAKHAGATWLDIRIARIGNRLELEITDDGVGGADPNGSGLMGLRRRVQALDGTLTVTSPAGGPTTIYAELPCV
jgi:signal transduction histidine kinase